MPFHLHSGLQAILLSSPFHREGKESSEELTTTLFSGSRGFRPTSSHLFPSFPQLGSCQDVTGIRVTWKACHSTDFVLMPRVSDSVGLAWGMRIFIAIRFPRDTTSLGTPFGETLPCAMMVAIMQYPQDSK